MRFVGIDPSTRTGFVALDEDGQVLRAKELTGVGDKDPKRMVTLIDEIMAHVQKHDVICIEGFAFGAKGQGVSFQYGLGHGIRNALFRRGIPYTLVTPAQLKKFTTGKGNIKKDEMAVSIYKKWGFEHSSDNVRDAYVLAKIAQAIWDYTETTELNYPKYQQEVIRNILNPPKKRGG